VIVVREAGHGSRRFTDGTNAVPGAVRYAAAHGKRISWREIAQ
jgi:hypothetical protein